MAVETGRSWEERRAMPGRRSGHFQLGEGMQGGEWRRLRCGREGKAVRQER